MFGRLIQTVRAHPFLSAGIAALVLAPAWVAPLFISLPREVTYTSHTVFNHCLRDRRQGMLCSSEYDVILGNTGFQETEATLHWPGDLRKWGIHHRVSNITADAPRTHDPVLRCVKEPAATTCRMERLAAGTLIELRLVCMACDPVTSALPESVGVEVRTPAIVFHGDPRVNAFLRRVQILGQLAHLF